MGVVKAKQIARYKATTAPQEILKAAAQEQADLIVLSTRGQSAIGKLLIGSVTDHGGQFSALFQTCRCW